MNRHWFLPVFFLSELEDPAPCGCGDTGSWCRGHWQIRVSESEIIQTSPSKQPYRESLVQGVMWEAPKCCCAINENNLEAETLMFDTS